jgi:hypothetical protein
MYHSREWKEIRPKVFARHGTKCHYCGENATQVDHLFPLKQFPELALSLDNLVPVCARCNEAKGNGVKKLQLERLVQIIEHLLLGNGMIEEHFHKGYVPLDKLSVLKQRKRGLRNKPKR